MNAGVYAIENTINNKVYIGSSVNITQRFNIHINQLDQNKHDNCHLQSAWNKYGEKNFTFTPLEYCEKGQLLEREQKAMDIFKVVDTGYNIRAKAENNLGVKYSEETKAKISIGNKGERNAMWIKGLSRPACPHCGSDYVISKGFTWLCKNCGKYVVKDENRIKKVFSLETRRKLSEAHKGKMLKEENPSWIKGISRPSCLYCGGDYVTSKGPWWHCKKCGRNFRKSRVKF